MTDKETVDARIKAATAFMKLSNNPLFNREFLALTGVGSDQETNPVVVAGPEERIDFTLDRFIKTGESQSSIVSLIEGEVFIRVVSPAPDEPGDIRIFDIFDDTTVYSWLHDENLHPEGIHVINGKKFLVGGNVYRKTIEKLCGFADN